MSEIDFEGTNPRIGVSVGITLPGNVKFSSFKPGVMVEMDVAPDVDVDKEIDELTDYLIGKLDEIAGKLEDYVNE